MRTNNTSRQISGEVGRGGLRWAALLAVAGAAVVGSIDGPAPAIAATSDSNAEPMPETITLTGTIRDFRERHESNGHPDFEKPPSGGFGHYVGMVQDDLGPDGKPVYRGGGYRISNNWRNYDGQNMIPTKPYIAEWEGDKEGALQTKTGALTTAESFDQWYRDTPGVNISKPLTLTLT
ncbi:MAG: hypothetical protein AAGB14_14770, partial [Verrucomicrobiota bacterium]